MDNEARRRRVEDDDSLLASVAGVPLTRMARIGLCFVWAGFWAARVLLTDAMAYFEQFRLKSGTIELLSDEPVDQAFSICMIWLTVEVVIIIADILKTGATMLIAKTPKSWTALLLERLPRERLEAELERRDKANTEKCPESEDKKS